MNETEIAQASLLDFLKRQQQPKPPKGSRKSQQRSADLRKAREQEASTPLDGRVRRTGSRDAQLNATIERDLKERAVRAARAHRMMLVEIVERALSDYLDKLDKMGE